LQYGAGTNPSGAICFIALFPSCDEVRSLRAAILQNGRLKAVHGNNRQELLSLQEEAMRFKSRLLTGFALCAALCGAGGTAIAQTANPTTAGVELPRAAWLGTQIGPGDGGVTVMSVNPAATGGRIGLQVDDVIVQLNATPTPDVPSLLARLRQISSGDAVELRVRRGSESLTLTGPAVARPPENFAGATTTLGAVSWQGGHLREILVMPERPAPGNPVVYFIQGASCMSIESTDPQHIYYRFVSAMVAAGIGVYRIEKPGMGDSRGTPACNAIDYQQELDSFGKGYDSLVARHGVDPRQIVIFGHSMGGIQGPRLIAEGRQVRGIVVMGVAVSPWWDYLQDLFRWQPVLSGNEDPATSEAFSEQIRPLISGLMNDPGGPRAVAAANPGSEQVLREVLGWDGGDVWMGRSSGYWRGVGTNRTTEAWNRVRVPVLALHGENDLAVIDDRDVRRLVAIVNRNEPGSAQLVRLPATNHDFTIDGRGFNPVLGEETARFVLGLFAN
jgi:pimeloyl-ACP methyl ester carboxylesterase